MKLTENFLSLKFLYIHSQQSVLSIDSIRASQEIVNQLKYSNDFYNSVSFSRSLCSQLSYFSIIQFCSFLDEYENFNSNLNEGNDIKERILKIRKKNKYGLRTINKKWPDLKNYRNNILAHNLQIKGKSFFENEENEILEYKVPGNLNEQILFIKIVEKICANIYFEFEDILDKTEINNYNIMSNLKIVIDDSLDLKNEIKLIDEEM